MKKEDYKSMYLQIKRDIGKGLSYEYLRNSYPLMTKSLYIKLGGSISRMRFKRNNPIVRAIVGSCAYEPTGEGCPDEAFLIGSLFGDGHIEMVSDNQYVRNGLYKTGHCLLQIGYIKLIYEALKPFSCAVFLRAPTGRLQDWSIHLSTICSHKFNVYRDLFYTYGNNETKEKDILNIKLIDKLSWKALSHWIMEDGKHRGGRYCFSICVGIQDRYPENRLKIFVKGLSDHFSMPFYWEREKLSYGIYTCVDSASIVKKNILPYIWPDFCYKFRCSFKECGDIYRDKPWFVEWAEVRKTIEHPFMSMHSYFDYVGSQDSLFRDRYLKFLLNQIQIRGYDAYSNNLLRGFSYRDFYNRRKLKEFVESILNGNFYE